jgi:hypothetical protein
VESAVWQRVEVQAGDDPVLAARQFKVLLSEHVPAADFHVWLDARFALHVDPTIFAPMLMRYDALAMLHPRCTTLADEAREIAGRGLVPEDVLERQMVAYEGMEIGIHYSTGLLVRRNSARCHRLSWSWLQEISQWGHTRDQMSFGYAASTSGLEIGTLEGNYLDNPYATWGRDG